MDYRDFLKENAPHLSQNEKGMWVADAQKTDTYPADTHAALARVEAASFWFQHRNRIISALVSKYRPSGTLVDVGGGNGFVAHNLCQQGFPVIVVEPDAAGALTAHARGIPTIHGALEPHRFAQNTIPAIGLFDVIEHMQDDEGFMRICHVLLADDGLLYATVPAFQELWSADDVFAKHQRRYTRQAIVHLMENAGFDVLTAGYFFSLLVPPLYALRTLPSKLGFRTVIKPDDAVKQHAAPPFLSKMMLTALLFEVDLLKVGRFMPFGTSLALVARKRKN